MTGSRSHTCRLWAHPATPWPTSPPIAPAAGRTLGGLSETRKLGVLVSIFPPRDAHSSLPRVWYHEDTGLEVCGWCLSWPCVLHSHILPSSRLLSESGFGGCRVVHTTPLSACRLPRVLQPTFALPPLSQRPDPWSNTFQGSQCVGCGAKGGTLTGPSAPTSQSRLPTLSASTHTTPSWHLAGKLQATLHTADGAFCGL